MNDSIRVVLECFSFLYCYIINLEIIQVVSLEISIEIGSKGGGRGKTPTGSYDLSLLSSSPFTVSLVCAVETVETMGFIPISRRRDLGDESGFPLKERERALIRDIWTYDKYSKKNKIINVVFLHESLFF